MWIPFQLWVQGQYFASLKSAMVRVCRSWKSNAAIRAFFFFFFERERVCQLLNIHLHTTGWAWPNLGP